uniref:pentatricopeptide repeat-containing protein At1g62914, mitochondrial-like n=1 Tax=Erigeron canadensis TaxID=72917 RepID=UPI001CB958F0|nr:pentatricopeptide repeat-containing protein At1g62914, mitochondrial-like [Erigeron canadensis]
MCAFGFRVNKYTAGIAVKCYCRLRLSKHGLTVMGFCFKQGVEPHVSTCNMLLKGFIREQMTYEAEQLFRLMNRRQLYEPNLVTYKTMIEGLCKVGSHYAAIGLLSLCKDRGMIDDVYHLLIEMFYHKVIPPNVHTYNSMIYGMSKLGYWDDVCLMLKRMENEKIHQDVKTFNIIVDALCKLGKINEAQAVIDIMDKTSGKHTPDIVTYNSLIEAYGWKKGEMREARRVLDSLASKCIIPTTVTYYKLVLGLMFGKYKDAVGLFHLMDGSGMNSDAYVHIILIRRAIKCHKFDDARRFFHDLLVADISGHKKIQREAIKFKGLHGNLDRASRHVDFEEWFPRVKLNLDW